MPKRKEEKQWRLEETQEQGLNKHCLILDVSHISSKWCMRIYLAVTWGSRFLVVLLLWLLYPIIGVERDTAYLLSVDYIKYPDQYVSTNSLLNCCIFHLLFLGWSSPLEVVRGKAFPIGESFVHAKVGGSFSSSKKNLVLVHILCEYIFFWILRWNWMFIPGLISDVICYLVCSIWCASNHPKS